MTEDVGSDIERLYRDHRDRLWRSVFLFAGDRDVATDAVAEAFAQALRRGSAIRSVLPWVWRAAFRIAAGELKERGRPVPVGAEAPPDEPEVAMRLAEALAKLGPRDRQATILRYYGDLSLREIAVVMHTTVPAVGMRLTRARRALRTLLEDDDG